MKKPTTFDENVQKLKVKADACIKKSEELGERQDRLMNDPNREAEDILVLLVERIENLIAGIDVQIETENMLDIVDVKKN